MTMQIIAIGQDEYWLSAIKRATTGWTKEPKTVKCPGSLLQCISKLPKPDINSVVLVDASGQGKMEKIVTALVSLGWEYVIVVAANFNANDAAGVFRKKGYDYWPKTYDEEVIRNHVRGAFDEIVKKEERKRTKRKKSKLRPI